ncbi:hypothetical protein C441_16274 [Haloferax sulfurifontis ATCC BAA-897]|uniref:Uncharacterized protein n=1 Tax=Haloferax sulfurifontis ATCC BAA-897 TaxID=662480 RepID=M0HZA6_9EURY|nr:hypothetical protein C441_16274 [Haloferax sulfurifontis ATCC BAA-897]
MQVACVVAGDLPAELCVVGFLGRTMNVENSLRLSIDESRGFECLNAVVRAAAVMLASVFAVEKGGINGGVTRKSCSSDESRSSTRQTFI